MFAGEVREYYDSTYIGASIPDEDFPRLQARAEDALTAATFGRFRGCHPPHVRDAILRAWCAQIESIYLYGDSADGTGGGFTVGHVSVQDGGSSRASGSLGGLCKRAVTCLAPTGLLYAGGVLV